MFDRLTGEREGLLCGDGGCSECEVVLQVLECLRLLVKDPVVLLSPVAILDAHAPHSFVGEGYACLVCGVSDLCAVQVATRFRAG